jgi:dynein heavy chain
MIDPQIQANQWLKNTYPDMVVYKTTQKNFLKCMSDAVYTGKTVLLEDISESLDPGLNTIIAK